MGKAEAKFLAKSKEVLDKREKELSALRYKLREDISQLEEYSDNLDTAIEDLRDARNSLMRAADTLSMYV